MINHSILITTKNRIKDLSQTLQKIESIIKRSDVECLIVDDGSTDGTSKFVEEKYPSIILIRHRKSKGYIHSRNEMLAMSNADYSISLDDDAHFLSYNILINVEKHFSFNNNCGVIACRIFWGKEEPTSLCTNQRPMRVKGYVGCGHVWNMKAWRSIPDYPNWFVFYGEEEFASYQLFKNGWQVHYLPEILVHHRVEISSRKSQKDYGARLRRSLRSGWYNYLLFLPWSKVLRLFSYTLYIQLKTKVFKGDIRAAAAIVQALLDLTLHLPKLISERNPLSLKEFREYRSLAEVKVYWNPKDEKSK